MTAYHEIFVEPSDTPNTAITTRLGLFKFVRTSCSFKNVAQRFQKFMDELTRGLPFIFVYPGDILVASRTHEELIDQLRLPISALDAHGLALKLKMCILGLDALGFLGHRISPQCIKQLESRTRAIEDFPSPTSFRMLRQFLGVTNFHIRFIPCFAHALQTLTEL